MPIEEGEEERSRQSSASHGCQALGTPRSSHLSLCLSGETFVLSMPPPPCDTLRMGAGRGRRHPVEIRGCDTLYPPTSPAQPPPHQDELMMSPSPTASVSKSPNQGGEEKLLCYLPPAQAHSRLGTHSSCYSTQQDGTFCCPTTRVAACSRSLLQITAQVLAGVNQQQKQPESR